MMAADNVTETRAADALLRRFLANWTASIEAHALPLGGRVLRRDGLAAADVGRPSFGGNVATLLAPRAPADLPGLMSALDTFYGFSSDASSGSVFLFSPWPTPDLQPHGWAPVGDQPLMLRPAGGGAPPPPPGLLIAEVRDEAGLRAFARAMVRGFEAAELAGQGPEALFSPATPRDDRVRQWVGWEGERPVCAASAFVDAGIVNVSLVGTVPEARRRGYGAALTWRATLADPSLPALLVATAEGQALYETMGYRPLRPFSVWARERPAPSGQISGGP